VDHTHKTEYRGWEITIRCMARLNEAGDAPSVKKYTASAHMALIEQSESGDQWIDARAQVVNLGSRHFESRDQCMDLLLGDVKELIDALKK
jgi:hypothetical protein